MRRFLCALCVAAGLGGPAEGKDIHGQIDAFKTPGVSMAWAVLRGPDEARTFIVVRLRGEAGIEGVVVTGRDPFTQASRELRRATLSNGRAEVRIPRSGFADHPRTEWSFQGDNRALPLTVFYLGVPDTTPEFADEARLAKYLEERLAGL